MRIRVWSWVVRFVVRFVVAVACFVGWWTDQTLLMVSTAIGLTVLVFEDAEAQVVGRRLGSVSRRRLSWAFRRRLSWHQRRRFRPRIRDEGIMCWLLALLEGVRFYPCTVPAGWWARWPFLPLPSKVYIKFRLDTAYGMVEHGWPRPSMWVIMVDCRDFLLWRRSFRLRAKR